VYRTEDRRVAYIADDGEEDELRTGEISLTAVSDMAVLTPER
jgi:hypothetical protein